MPIACRAWLLACLLAACANTGSAPVPDTAATDVRAPRVAALREALASTDLHRKEWAAWIAGEEGLVELVPELVRELEVESRRQVEWNTWPSYANVLLDSLVLLGARVPARVLDPYLRGETEHQRIPAYILAARDPAANLEALAAADRSSRGEGGKAAGRVFEAATPRLAALRALRAAQLEVRLEVLGPGDAPPAEIGHPSPEWHRFALDKAAPPAAVYSLDRTSERWEVEREGLTGVLRYRRTLRSGDFELPLRSSDESRGSLGAARLAILSGSPLTGVTTLTTESLDAEGFCDLVLPVLDQQRADWNSALRALLERGVIDPSMALLPAPVSLQCIDRRPPGSPSVLEAFARVESAWNARLRERRSDAIELSPEQVEVLRADLRSDALERRAWAAFACGEADLRSLGKELRESLASLRALGRPRQLESVVHGMLDTLIRLQVPMRSDELLEWQQQGVDPELLLLAANDPANCADFLDHCVAEPTPFGEHELRWLTASNLLARADRKRAVALALKDLEVTFAVFVGDDPDLEVPGPLPMRSYRDSIRREISESFPPFAYYTLDPAPPGANVVGHRHPTVCGQTCFEVRRVDAHSFRLDLLRKLAEFAATEPALDGYVDLKQVWTTPAALLEEVRARRAALRTEWRALLEALEAQGLLDAADRARELPLKLRIEDLRKDQSGPFPDLES